MVCELESFPLFACESKFLEVLMCPPKALYILTLKHTCSDPHLFPQTHMNPELKELKEISQLTMFHKRSIQDILYE